MERCLICGSDNLNSQAVQCANGLVCRACNKRGHYCHICGRTERLQASTTIQHRLVICQYCVLTDRYFSNCVNCQVRTLHAAMRNVGKRSYHPPTNVAKVCINCFSTSLDTNHPYVVCGHCGNAFPRIDVKLHPSGHISCQTCWISEETLSVTRKPLLKHPDRSSNYFLGSEYYGIEVECYHQHQNGKRFLNDVPQWGWCYDGSVKGPEYHTPQEFLSPILWGNSGLVSISNFLSTLKTKSCGVNASCGLHVHVQSVELTPPQICNVLKTWDCIEPWVLKALPPHRHASKHAQRAAHDHEKLNEIKTNLDLASYWYKTLINENVLRAVAKDKYNPTRYAAVNLHSHFHRGTIEFRLHHGTLNFTKIKNWVEICTKIVDMGKNLEQPTLDSFLKCLDKTTITNFNKKD